jgi:hypothetical protein
MLSSFRECANSFFSKRVIIKNKPKKGEIYSKPEIRALIEFPNIIFLFLMNRTPLSDISKTDTRIMIGLIIFSFMILYSAILDLIIGVIGFIITYQIYYNYGAIKSGNPAWGMIIYKNMHIHHWLYSTIGFILSIIFRYNTPFLTGLFFGGIVHGIQFIDWNHIKVKNQ